MKSQSIDEMQTMSRPRSMALNGPMAGASSPGRVSARPALPIRIDPDAVVAALAIPVGDILRTVIVHERHRQAIEPVGVEHAKWIARVQRKRHSPGQRTRRAEPVEDAVRDEHE